MATWANVVLDPQYCVLEFQPNAQRDMWTYATCGMSDIGEKDPIELHLFSSKHDSSLIELLTIVAYYHKTDTRLGIYHTVNFDRSWQPNSICTYGLISLPYLDGPTLEILNVNQSSIHIYWLLPITHPELKYKVKYGVEALEQKFEENNFNYLDPIRRSVI